VRDDRHGAAEIGRATDAEQDVGAAGPAGVAARPRNGLRRADETDESAETGEPLHHDPLRRRMAEHDARAARERQDRERLRRSMRQREDEPSRGSGAFLTGFLLVVLVAGAMLAAYLLAPEIIARVPESEPVLTEYVATMDDLRVSIAEGYERARAWVMDVVANAA
jgi:hypothetical protein